MKMFFNKLILRLLKKLMKKFSEFLTRLKNTLKFGLTINHFGLLIQRKYMKNLEMILHYGKIY